MNIEFKEIELNVDWREDNSLGVDQLPTKPGIYAEIFWRTKGVRIGETGNSIRGKIRHDIRWFKSMHDGTAPESQLRRTLPIARAAIQYGHEAFSYYVVSVDERLSEKLLRQECERFMFKWVENNNQFDNWNRQRSWR